MGEASAARVAVRLAAAVVAVAVIQIVWYYVVVVAVHVAFLDGPVPRGPGAKVLLYGLAYLPTLLAAVVALVFVLAWRHHREVP